ncbi:hypothetical protein CAPN002_00070 [Capnocytophaga stomatis]|uniref:hypothetical protein n=1 Tax=Capnocytophaga stomatis TaxID=1848904 RepID=UPI001950FBD4|nr:hypothetical protein [Capnocytophaga stomatis]GIJ92789.1 hypothetical protein CAPN002_00070 [Capnocytophaga stomatis]
MKNIFFIVIVALLATSCSKSDSGDSEKKPEQDSVEQLLGTWNGKRFFLSADGKVLDPTELKDCEKQVRIRVLTSEGKNYLFYNNECIDSEGKKEKGEGFSFYLKGNQMVSSDYKDVVMAIYTFDKEKLIIDLALGTSKEVLNQRFIVTKTSSKVSLD